MKFFATSETYKTVSEKIRMARNIIEGKIKLFVKNKNYGESIIDWGYITICDVPEIYEAGFFKEIKKYSNKKKEVEFRLRIDYDKMLKANEKETFRLICESILRSIDIAESELKIKDFDFSSFRNDLTHLFRKENWIK